MPNLLTNNFSSSLIQDVRPLIVEDVQKVLTEMVDPKDGKKKTATAMRVTGIFQEADSLNANSRMYPLEILSEAVNRIRPMVEARKVMGEFDHPPDAKIHLDRVSHLITKLWMDGKRCFGTAEILEHVPYGQQLKGLIEQNVIIGVSSRGVGDMESFVTEGKSCFKVLPGYGIVTFDAVAEPSVQSSELSMMESINRKVNKDALLKKHLSYKLLEEFKRYLKA